jgi:DNA-binding CsgD family transcriptional regulator
VTPPEAPTPILPMGAGGPPRRAAGRVFPALVDDVQAERSAAREQPRDTPAETGGLATVVEPDPLLRLHAVAAALQLGFSSAEATTGDRPAPAAIAAMFVGLDTLDACPRCRPAAGRRPAVAASLVVGYAMGGRELLAAHRRHACCDLFLELRAVAGKACFVYLPTGGAVEQARLTTREADVLVLVLGGLSTAALAERLCVSPATARTHCRALLRKLGAADRRTLCARLLGGESAMAGTSALGRSSQGFAQPAARSLPRNPP